MTTYKIYTLGCKVNQYDSGKLAAELKRAGLKLATGNVNLAIINSCAVTKTAMIKSGRMIKLARKENPRAKIALAGCWPRVHKIKNVDADFVVTGDKIGEIVREITNYELRITNEIQNLIINNNRARYFIKIQDGCEQFCSYCIIPYARGKLRSRPAEEVVGEIEQAIKAGYGEIVLSGIHLGLYGQEDKLSLASTALSVIPASEPESRFRRAEQVSGLRVKPAMTNYKGAPRNDKLGNLIKEIIKIKNLGRIRLSSIEITEVTDELINLMAKSRKICRHLHLPLQAGNDKILKLMNRPYDTLYFKNKIKQIRLARPDSAITTDVITGFPGETEEDFKATEKFIRQIKFSRLHVFPFSSHEKTLAAKMPNQVEEKTKTRRAEILRELGLKLARDYKKRFKGRRLEIAVEQIKQNKIIGKSEYYFEVEADKKNLKDKNIRVGEIVKIKI